MYVAIAFNYLDVKKIVNLYVCTIKDLIRAKYDMNSFHVFSKEIRGFGNNLILVTRNIPV